MVFHWSLSDSKSPQVSGTLLSILAVLNKAVVWMVSTRPPISKSSSPFKSHLVTVPNVPITIGVIVTCMFHSFFQFPSKVEVLILLFISFQFYPMVCLDSKIYNFAIVCVRVVPVRLEPFVSFKVIKSRERGAEEKEKNKLEVT